MGKKRSKSGKGSNFEREFSKLLSLWFSEGESDSLFWRSSQSGGRATNREKSGLKTKGQYGDISAIVPEGQPLVDLVSIELKNGYNSAFPVTVIDKGEKGATQIFEGFLEQAKGDSERAEVPYWWLVHKRDRREPMLYAPLLFWADFDQRGTYRRLPYLSFRVNKMTVIGVKLSCFFGQYTPQDIHNMKGAT